MTVSVLRPLDCDENEEERESPNSPELALTEMIISAMKFSATRSTPTDARLLLRGGLGDVRHGHI